MRDLQKISVQSPFEHSVALMPTYDVHNVDIIKSKCCSKSKYMLKYSVILLMLKWDGELKAILD